MGIVAVGQSVARQEDPRLLRGAGSYIADFNAAGQTHAYVLRSPYAHARITAIDTATAARAPGVLRIITGADYQASGLSPMPVVILPVPNLQADKIYKTERWPLVTDRVRFVGDGVAFVVAETLSQAKDAAELIEVEYEALPSVTATSLARAPDSAQVWDDCANNTCFEYQLGNQPETDAAFEAADIVVRQRMVINRVAPSSIEARGTLADYDPETDHWTVHIGTQGPFGMRRQLADLIFHEPESKFHLVTGDIGGSFGMKGLYPETVLTIWASKLLGRPVKWVSERIEALLSDTHGRDKIVDAALALDKDGRFLGLRVNTVANLGAYMSPMALAHTTLSLGGLAGVYTTPAIHVTVHAAFTNTAPTAPYRGSGRPDASYVIERLIDVAAAQTGIDRLELRRRNLIPSSAMPYKTPLGPTYDCGDFACNLDDALAKIDYAGFEERRTEAAQRGKLRGIGFANNIENAGAAGVEFSDIRFAPDGTVTVAAGTTDNGQGHATMYTQIISERLGMEPDDIKVIEGDTEALAHGSGTGGSRVSALGSGAVALATDGVIENGRKLAAHLLETAEQDIEFSDARFTVAGTDRSMTLAEVVAASFDASKRPEGVEAGLFESAEFRTQAPNFPNGCHICEVEIDRETGVAKVARYVAVNDVGRVINPLQLAGQIHGGVMQGVGQALMEQVVYDSSDGQIQTGSFMDYAMPRSTDICDIEVSDNPTYTKSNPLGAKGGGELGAACAVPAVVNAVVDALSPCGISHLDMPLTPEKIWEVINR